MSFLKDFDHLRIQLKDVLSATNNFSSANMIGRGGFGNVYKGEIKGQITVAFKRLDRRLGQGNREFWKEVMMLSRYKHENLINLMHFCVDGDQMILVYEYASLGSLDRYLANPNTLTWIQRLKISVGVARGLEFLHDPKKAHQRLIHRDIKSGNILLDEKWKVKVSDFGLSKLAPANQQHTYVVSDAVGTYGYTDPLYMETGCLTKESDVYSFGVVLFEILCGRLCYRYHQRECTIFVLEWRRCYEENRLDEIILPGLKQEMDPGSLRTFSAIAHQCMNKDREDRPTMAQVLLELEFSLEQQELFENHRKRVGFLESMQQKNKASQVSFESSVSNKYQEWAAVDDNSQPPPVEVSDEDDSPVRARQAVQLLVEVLNTGLEKEQHDAIAALVRLLSDNPSRALAVADIIETNSVDILSRILSSNCSIDVKVNTTELCRLLFANATIRSSIAAARCVEPLISLLVSESASPGQQHSVLRALDKLIDDEKLGELVTAYGAIIPLVRLVCGNDYMLHKASSRVLVKLGKDRASCKMEMVKAGVIEGTLDILHEAPRFFFTAFAELLEILTSDATIAKGPSAAKVVEPLLLFLTSKPEVGTDSQRSALQVLVNILMHPQCRAECTLSSSYQVIQPLIPLLDSHAPVVQQLTSELLSHLLLEEHYLKDPICQQVIGPLIRVLGSGIPNLQQRAVKALDRIVVAWPHEIAKQGGVAELLKVILRVDPSLELQKSATVVLSSILPFSSEFPLEVPLALLVQLLGSGYDATVVSALNALEKLATVGSISVVTIAESGAIEALFYLLRCHRCEETAARLLKLVLTDYRIRETNIAERAILPLSDYLFDTQTQSQGAKLLVTIALGDLFQNETLTRSEDAESGCRAFVNLLKDQHSEELKVVAIGALKNLVRYSGSNTTVVAEAGGVKILLDLIVSSETNTSLNAAMLIELVFSTDVIEVYASGETVRGITAGIENNLRTTGTGNHEYIKALNALFENCIRSRATEAATLSIKHLVTSLKTGSEATQEAALHSLFLLSQAWSTCQDDVSRSQSNAAADAIPLLQYLIQSGPPRFQHKAEILLMRLPGTLSVIIKRARNMNPPWGKYSYSCNLTLGTTPSRQTKESLDLDPQWYERFEWHFESPPTGQKLSILCMMTGKMFSWAFHKVTMTWGKVTIPIDRVVILGVKTGEYNMGQQSKSASDTSMNLDVEIRWSKAP